MKLTAELSLYPLQEDYIPIIRRFIDQLNQQQRVRVVTNAMSTQLCGDFQDVIQLINDTLAYSCSEFGKQVLVCKFIPGELAIAG
ncbi:MAG: hypothetical protein CR978_01415 [Gammaproteobacteria bacterium]|nr:MAG: hypothetical protein CR978_01415 [Gammaproteobacteria bacterium]